MTERTKIILAANPNIARRTRVQVIVPRGPHQGDLLKGTATIGVFFVEWHVGKSAAVPFGLRGSSSVNLEGVWWCRGWRAPAGRALQVANALHLGGG